MITIDQIQNLDRKVQSAIALISSLKAENTSLKGKLDMYQKRISELEVLVENFKKDQVEIEQGIVRALAQLDQLEDSLEDTDEPGGIEPEGNQGDQEAGEPSPDGNATDGDELDIF